jgi:hypothetical protein
MQREIVALEWTLQTKQEQEKKLRVFDPERDHHDSNWTDKRGNGVWWGQKDQGPLYDLPDRRITRVYTKQFNFNSSRSMNMCYRLEASGSTPDRGMRFFSASQGSGRLWVPPSLLPGVQL